MYISRIDSRTTGYLRAPWRRKGQYEIPRWIYDRTCREKRTQLGGPGNRHTGFVEQGLDLHNQ